MSDWFGVLPAVWSTRRVADLFVQNKTRNSGLRNENLLSLSYGKIIRRDIKSVDGLLPASFEDYQVVQPGDIVLRLTDMQNDQRSLRSGLVVEDGIITAAYLGLRSRVEESRYMAYAFRALDLSKQLYALGSGLRQSMSWEDVKSVRMPWPGVEERGSIVDFLEGETAELDVFIADQLKLIELLTERRRAEITRIVSVASEAETWRATTVGRTFRVLDCKHVTVATVEGGYPLASIREIGDGAVILDEARTTSYEDFCLLTEGGRQPKEGDLIVSRNASVGKVGIVPPGLPPFALGQDVSLIRQSSADARTDFLQFVLRSMTGASAFDRASIGSTFKRINVDDIKAIRFSLPDQNVQQVRVRAAINATQLVDEAIADAREAIALSQERRTALISAAVTGQIDVTEKKRVLV